MREKETEGERVSWGGARRKKPWIGVRQRSAGGGREKAGKID